MSPVRIASRPRPNAKYRTRALLSTATLAIAVAFLHPVPAKAQFNGTGTPVNGIVTGEGTDTINIGSSTAIIDWTANSNVFLEEGVTQNFTSNLGSYTVLNNVMLGEGSGPIELNGFINSYVNGGTSTIGGNIWFYSPGGIVVGPNAVFDVGGLLLTSLQPTFGNPDGTGFNETFTGGAASGTITIEDGASITASGDNAYVVAVGPRIVQGGDILVDGSVALVAAEGATINANMGLFDVHITVGTSDPNGVVHTGDTLFNEGGTTNPQRIYIAAVYKNAFSEMLLGGNLGFEASAASLDNGAIILSAGAWIDNSGGGDPIFMPAGDVSDSTIIIGGTMAADFNADTIGWSNSIDVHANSGDIDFARDLTLTAIAGSSGSEVRLYADGSGDINVGGDATLTSLDTSGSGNSYVWVESVGRSIDITGTLTANVDAIATLGFNATAGDIDILARSTGLVGGTVTAGSMDLSAVAFAADAIEGGSGGDAFGGVIYVWAGTDSTINVNGDLTASANAMGGDAVNFGNGGDGEGGEIYVTVENGNITVDGDLDLTVDGTGGGGAEFAQGYAGGTGTGGEARIFSEGDGAGIGIEVGGNVALHAQGTGGAGARGGVGQGGTAGISAWGGLIDLGTNAGAQTIALNANGWGGNATSGAYVGGTDGTGTGGDGIGGMTFIRADAFDNGEGLQTTGTIHGEAATLNSDGYGGTGGTGNGDNTIAGTGGVGFGGMFFDSETGGGAFVLSHAAGGSLTLSSVIASSSGVGGVGGTGANGEVGGIGGDGFGGTVQSGNYNPATSSTGQTIITGNLTLNSIGQGGAGGNGGTGANAGNGGDGYGGESVLWAPAYTEIGSLNLYSQGSGGVGYYGGDGYGGTMDNAVLADLWGGTLGTPLAWVWVDDSGELVIHGDSDVAARGFGGNALADGSGGFGMGGDARLTVDAGGTMSGGLDLNDAILPTGEFILAASGFGGIGGDAGGDGGDATGGHATATIDGDATLGFTAIRGRSVAGAGGTATTGQGGTGGGSSGDSLNSS